MTEDGSSHRRAVDWAQRFPRLYQLFGGHLIESWTSVYDSSAAALQDGIDARTLDELRDTLLELNELRAQDLGDEELDRVLFHDLRSYYHRPGGTYSAWLDEVAAQLAESIKLRGSENEGSSNAIPQP